MRIVTLKKGIFVAVALAMLATSIIGCQSTVQPLATSAPAAATSAPAVATTAAATEAAATPAPVEEPGWKKDASKPITIDWYVNETWYNCPDGNLAHDYIQELTGVNLNFIVPVGDAGQKLNTMIASDSLPDMVTLGWYEQQVPQLETDDYVYALSDLSDKYDPDFMKEVAPDIVNWYKAKDGKLYAYPCNGNTPDDTTKYNVISNRSFLVRKDIYEGIGSPDMRTPDGFLKAMKDAKAKYPTVDNGQPLIPFGMTAFTSTGNTALEDMLLEFLSVPREENGQYFDVKCANPDPDYIKWMKTFRQAYADGAIPTDVFVDDRTKIEEKIQQGRYFALLYQWKDAMNPLGQLYANKPNEIYIEVNGPANSKLDTPKLGVSGYSGWEVTMITKNAKDPKRCIEFMTFGWSEAGQKAVYLGKEGVTYDMVGGKPVIKDDVNKLKNSDMATFKQKYNTYGEIWMFNSDMMNLWEPDPGQPFTQYREFNKGKAQFYGLYDNITPPADSDEYDILTKAQNKWGEYLPKLIMAKDDAEFDKLWQEYQDYKTTVNYQKALDYERKQVQANKDKIGAK